MDIFCKIREKLAAQIIEETAHFYVLHDGYPLMEGHLLIIPKKHVDCFLNLDKSLRSEYNALKENVKGFLCSYYSPPVFFEHGVAGQSVLHAHMHALPTGISIEKQIRKVAQYTGKIGLPYLYYEIKSTGKFFKPVKEIAPGYLHSIAYARALHRPLNGPERGKELPKWLLQVKCNWCIWRKK